MGHRYFLLVLVCAVLAGCHPEKNDSHTDVFQTPDQLAAGRRKEQLKAHAELAISLLHFERPDVQAQATDSGITVQADGVQRQIDLLPIEDELEHQTNQERPILHRYLQEQLRTFDQQRLASMSFAAVRPMVRYQLVNPVIFNQMQKDYSGSPLCTAQVVANLIRLTVVQRDQMTIPVNQELVKSWHVNDAELDAAAQAGLRQMITAAGQSLFETINYPTFGDCGTLKVDGAVILSPDFLTTVRQQWQVNDNLVIFMPWSKNVQFVASKNQKLLGLLNPQWQKVIASMADPLYRLLLLRSSDSIAVYVYEPATKPAATKPATKPHIYIVQ
jgi:hypothetical protein